MRPAILGVVIAYLVVGGTEAYLHWYAGSQPTATAQALKEWYSRHDALNGKAYHQGFADLLFPAIILGLAAGYVTARQPERLLVWSVFLLCLGIVALMPFYAAVTPTKESDEWWRFASTGVRTVAFIPGYFKGALLCLFFGGIGRALGLSFRRTIRVERCNPLD